MLTGKSDSLIVNKAKIEKVNFESNSSSAIYMWGKYQENSEILCALRAFVKWECHLLFFF